MSWISEFLVVSHRSVHQFLWARVRFDAVAIVFESQTTQLLTQVSQWYIVLFVYAIGLIILFKSTLWYSKWGHRKWELIQNRIDSESQADRVYIASLHEKIKQDRLRYLDLSSKLRDLKTAFSLLKVDEAGANMRLVELRSKHLKAHSSLFTLQSEMETLSSRHELVCLRRRQQQQQIRFVLSLTSRFFLYSKYMLSKNKIMVQELEEWENRCSDLRQKHKYTFDSLTRTLKNYRDSQKAITVLNICLDNEVSTTLNLRNTCAELEAELSSAKKHGQTYQSLAWSIASRFDKSQTDYAQQLVNADQRESHLEGLRNDLCTVLRELQVTQDMAQAGLGELQNGTTLKPLKYKETIMKISHSIELSRLRATELLTDMRQSEEGNIYKTVFKCVPGSVRDAERKLKVALESSRSFTCDDEFVEDFYFTTGDETLLDCPEHEVEDKSSSPCLKGSHNLSDMLEEGPQDIENQLTSSDHFRGLSCH